MTEPTTVPCPTCNKRVPWTDASPYKPFCSERCKLIDLGAWFTEERAIPVDEQESWSGEES
ncbi:MAG: DNA gyrase inhibitor YacG [Pseudomonadota bacterium]